MWASTSPRGAPTASRTRSSPGSKGPACPLDVGVIGRAAGRSGTLEHGVFKIMVPRRDLAVTAAGAKLVPAMGLTSWAAFTRAGDQTVVMGDLTLSEAEAAVGAAGAAGMACCGSCAASATSGIAAQKSIAP
jgi:hypothetical protein